MDPGTAAHCTGTDGKGSGGAAEGEGMGMPLTNMERKEEKPKLVTFSAGTDTPFDSDTPASVYPPAAGQGDALELP